jgi:phosphohistidine swiveling domain-containing protein
VDQGDLSAGDMFDKDEAARSKVEAELKAKLSGKPLLSLVTHFVLKRAKVFIMYRENSRLDRSRVYGIVRSMFRAMGQKLVDVKAIEAVDDIFYLTEDEIFTWVEGSSVNPDLKPLIRLRKDQYQGFEKMAMLDRMHVQGFIYQMKIFDNAHAQQVEGIGDNVLTGTACAAGTVEAEACIVRDAANAPSIAGKILIAEMTDPGWVFLMLSAAGLISEKGSILSHTAIIGRELGIPTIVGVKHATQRIPNGARIHMDGENGQVKIVKDPASIQETA